MTNTKTFQNLMNSFAGESQARQRYEMYAKIAKKEGWNNIASVFSETASNEYYHAKEFYTLLIEMVGEENIPLNAAITAQYPIARKSTYDNLIYAATGETEEVTIYSEFANIAREEGFKKIAVKFDLIGKVEGHHAARYKKIADLLEADTLLSKEEPVSYKCDVCGHIHYGKSAPKKCPICDHNSGHFELFELNV